MSNTTMNRKQTSPKQTAAAVKAALTRAGLPISRTTGRFAHYGHGTRVTTRGLGIFQHGASAAQGAASIHDGVAVNRSDLEENLFADAHLRTSLVDHFYDPAATADDGVRWAFELVKELGIPGLSAYGIHKEDVGELVGKAIKASSMKANPITLTPDELAGILERAL